MKPTKLKPPYKKKALYFVAMFGEVEIDTGYKRELETKYKGQAFITLKAVR